jgi:membrane protein YdbS with pleckstrin-like domain
LRHKEVTTLNKGAYLIFLFIIAISFGAYEYIIIVYPAILSSLLGMLIVFAVIASIIWACVHYLMKIGSKRR